MTATKTPSPTARPRDGRSTREIGEYLSISPVTVRRHVQALLQKMRATTRRDALALLDG